MKSHILTISVIAIAIFIILNNLLFFPNNLLSYDVFGYYLYLPLQFIYHDLGLRDDTLINSIIEEYNSTITFYQAMKLPDGNYVMKYTMGLSFFYAPFFFIGHLLAGIFNYPVDGFSIPYVYSIFFGNIIYTIIGIWALSNVLMRFFQVKIVILTLILIVFSTNYLLHMTMDGQNAMPQNFLFTTYALILWLSIKWHETHKLKHIILLSFICAITILSRPSEIVCLIIPLLWNVQNPNTAINKLKLLSKYKIHTFVFIAILILFASFQMIYWKTYTGEYVFYSYGANAGEGFDFFRPHIMDVLFSFRKGWLIYTPIMMFAIAGFYFIYIKNRSLFFAIFIYFICNLYLVSSWSCWWYAQSFSQRALIPSYPVMAMGLGYFLTSLNNQKLIVRGIIYACMLFFMLLNIFQVIQFKTGVMHGDRMSRPYYFRVFGKLYPNKEDKKLMLVNRTFDGNEIFDNENEYKSKFLKKMDFNEQEGNDSIIPYSGAFFRLDSAIPYSPKIDVHYNQISDKDHVWVRISAYVYPTQELTENTFNLVTHFNHKDVAYKYKAFKLDTMNLKLNQWNKINMDYLTPEIRSRWDNLIIYFWYQEKHPIYIDDLQVHIYEKE